MDVIKRNFFRLLRFGAFNEYEPTEPMSAYKWGLLQRMAQVHYVEAIVNSARDNTRSQDPMLNVPDAGLSRLCNGFLNRRLQKIRDAEPNSAEPSIETLNMLDIIVQTTERLILHGVTYAYILNMGIFLRNYGDRIDFVKLEKWLQRLNILSMAELEASILIYTLGFQQDEIPFVRRVIPAAYNIALSALYYDDGEENDATVSGRHIFTLNSGGKLTETFRNCQRCFFYAPLESVSVFFTQIASYIANMEE